MSRKFPKVITGSGVTDGVYVGVLIDSQHIPKGLQFFRLGDIHLSPLYSPKGPEALLFDLRRRESQIKFREIDFRRIYYALDLNCD